MLNMVKAFLGGILAGLVGIVVLVVTSGFAYVMGLVATMIGLLIFKYIVPEAMMDEVPRSVLVSVMMIVPFVFVTTGSVKASLNTK